MTYNPLTKVYALGRDVDVNYLLRACRDVIDAVLFDLDGTLADTAPDMARTVNRHARAPRPRARCRSSRCAPTSPAARAA